MTPKPFEHSFNTAFDIDGVCGYIRALTDVLHHIEEATQFNPEKRYIDSVDLINRIQATNIELMELSVKAEESLIKEADNILNDYKNTKP